MNRAKSCAWLYALIVAVAVATLCFSPSGALAAEKSKKGGWVTIFDGKSLDGWKINENKGAWSVVDGAIVANGSRSHLFYVGDKKPFVNFEFTAEVMTKPGANSGIYFHTKYQDSGWPKHGFEAQVNNTYTRDPIKTGSLYQVVIVKKAPAEDNRWFAYSIKVDGRRVVVKIDGKTVVDYTEPDEKKPGKQFTRKLNSGTFAIQAHDPKSKVLYRKIKVRRLP